MLLSNQIVNEAMRLIKGVYLINPCNTFYTQDQPFPNQCKVWAYYERPKSQVHTVSFVYDGQQEHQPG